MGKVETAEPIIYNRKNQNIAMPSYVTVGNRFRFNQGAINLIGLRVGEYLHLLEFGENDWYFMTDKDQCGIKLCHEGFHVVAHAVKICQIFKSRANARNGGRSVSFYIESTNKEYKGKRLWKIRLDRQFMSKRSIQ